MCCYSMVCDQALKWPNDWWKNPVTPLVFDNILEGAKEYDRKTGQMDCELEEKRELLRKLADQLGISINFK